MTGGSLAISGGIKVAKGDFAQANTADKQKSFQPEETHTGLIDLDARLARASAIEDSGQNLLGNDLNAVNLFDYSELELDPATADRLRAIDEALQKDARAAGKNPGNPKTVQRKPSPSDHAYPGAGSAALDFIRGFEALFGKKIEFVDTSTPDTPFAGLVNTSRSNTMYLHARGDRNVLALTGHEWGHTLSEQDPDLYQELQLEVLPYVDNWKKRAGELTDYRRKVRSEELTNNIVGDSFTRPAMWALLSEKNKPLFARVVASIRQWFEAILQKARGSSWGTESFITDLEAVHKAVMKALEKAAQKGPYSELPSVDDAELSTPESRKHGSPKTSKVRFSKGSVNPSDVGRVMLELGNIPETAKLGPTPAQKDLQSILETLAPEEAKEIKIINDPWPLGEGFAIESPGGGIYLLKKDASDYFVDSSDAGKYGTEIYQAIYAWAHNNEKVIHEDRAMYDDGIYRRTSQMLSSAIRHKTTKHFTIGKLSGIENWAAGDSPAATEHNIGLLALRERDLVMNRLPELKSLRYDIPTRSYYDGEFRIPDAEVKTYIERRIEGMDQGVSSRVGHATARRVLFIDALERSWTGASESTLVGHQSGSLQSLTGVRYAKDSRGSKELEADDPRKGDGKETSGSRLWQTANAGGVSQVSGSRPPASGGKPASVSRRLGPEGSSQFLGSNPPTVSQVEQILDGIQSRWGSRLKTKVHASVREISDARLRADALEAGNVEAFFDPNDGTIHIIADRVTSVADAERLLRHEGIHWALTGPLKKQYAAIREQAGRRIPWDEMQKLIAKYPDGNVDLWIEEYLAYQGQTNPQSTVWRQFVLEVKTLLKNLGINVEFTDADILAFLQKANRRMEQAREADQRFFDASNREALYAKSKPKGPQRSSWDEVRKGDRWNSVKKLLPKENIQPPALPNHGTKDEIVTRAGEFLTSNSIVTDWTGRSVYLPYGQTKGNYIDPILNRAEHVVAYDADQGTHQRQLDREKASWLAAVPTTIKNGRVRVRTSSGVLYFRRYGRDTHLVITSPEGVFIEQNVYNSGLVTQFTVDLNTKSYPDGIVDAIRIADE
jgi:hypothetical protein